MDILEQLKKLRTQILAEGQKQQKKLDKELGAETSRIINKLHPVIQNICNTILDAYNMTCRMSRIEFDVNKFSGISHIQCSENYTHVLTEEDKMRGMHMNFLWDRQGEKEKKAYIMVTFNLPKLKDYCLVIGNPGYRYYENGVFQYVETGEYIFQNSEGRNDHPKGYIYFEPTDNKFYKSEANWESLAALEDAFDNGLEDEIMRNIYLSIYDNLSSLEVDNRKLKARLDQIEKHKDNKKEENK